jgi:hypothetical protein
MEQMIQLLRSAVCLKSASSTLPIYSGTDTDVSFYAQVPKGNTTVGQWGDAFNPGRWTLSFDSTTGRFTASVTANASSPPNFTPAATSTSRILTSGVRQTGTTPVFRYYAYDSSGNLDPYNGATPLDTTAPGGLSATDKPKVAVVRITFSVKASGKGVVAADSDSSFDEIVRLRLVDPQAPNPQNGSVCRA